MAELIVRDIMTVDPLIVSPEVGVVDAARIMAENDIGALPVVEDGHLVGIVTEGDLIMQDVRIEYPTYIQLLDGIIMYPRAQAKFESELRKAVAATVRDVMTAEPVSVSVEASVEDVATLFAERDVSRLPVLDDGVLVGIVSKHDIVKAIAKGLT